MAKRIADQANETQRKVENRNTVKALEARVEARTRARYDSENKGRMLHSWCMTPARTDNRRRVVGGAWSGKRSATTSCVCDADASGTCTSSAKSSGGSFGFAAGTVTNILGF